MNIIRELRKRADMQQKALAAEVGVSVATDSDWETQKKDPSGERLHKLSEIFGVDELVILGVVPPATAATEKAPPQSEAKLNEFLIEFLKNASEERCKLVLDFLELPDEQQAQVIDVLRALKSTRKG